jgi:hypothetical protein
MLKQIEVLPKFPTLLSDNLKHLNSRFRLLLFTNDAQVQPSDAENHLSKLSLPLSIFVELSF